MRVASRVVAVTESAGGIAPMRARKVLAAPSPPYTVDTHFLDRPVPLTCYQSGSQADSFVEIISFMGWVKP